MAITMSIRGKDKVTVFNGSKTIGIYKFDGEKLIGAGGKTIAFSAEEKRQAVIDAIAAYAPDTYIKKRGSEMTDADRKMDWTFEGVIGDAHGVYSMTVPGTGAIEINF